MTAEKKEEKTAHAMTMTENQHATMQTNFIFQVALNSKTQKTGKSLI